MKKTIENKKMKPAYIENVIIWMVMLIGFATFFFFVIDYATIVRVKDNMDALSDYGARTVAVSGTDSTTLDNLVTRFNAMTVSGMANIASGDLVCNSVTDTPPRYQVIFNTQTAAGNTVEFYNQQMVSTRAVFNEVDSQTVTCTLTVTYN